MMENHGTMHSSDADGHLRARSLTNPTVSEASGRWWPQFPGPAAATGTGKTRGRQMPVVKRSRDFLFPIFVSRPKFLEA
jgi:hypothetical protein